MEFRDARNIMESLLFITEQPIPIKSFEDLFDKEFSREDLLKMAEDIALAYQSRASALELREIAGGWQFSSRPEFAPWIRKLFKDRLTYRLSASALETLSIIAYKQPITRSEIEEIRGAGERAAGLTKQLLAFGRRQISRPRPLDLNAVIHDAAQMLQRLIGEDITLETSLDPALEAGEADPGQVHQVLLNLSINARDAMTDGGALTISTANARFEAGTAPPGCQAGAYATLTVADTGTGMDEDTMRHLFEPFFTTKPDGFGTGLGLATVYGIVEQSGGSIQVHSEPGKGCRFDIHLPCAKGPVEPVTPSALKTPEQRRDLTVLVVEDQDSVRGLASRALRDCGYNVLEAGSGEEAVGLAGAVQDGCQLVVTDVVMPGMSGKAMADELRARWPEVKVLFMSGYPNEVLLRHGLMNGEIDYLEKPFTPAELAAKVREVMG